jgi:hypothetical protein
MEKTELFLLHNTRANLPAVLPSLVINDMSLEFKVDGTLRWLGVLFDPGLTMINFIQHNCRICFALLRMVRQIRDRLDKPSMLLLCNAVIIPRVDYCNSLLTGCTKAATVKLQRVINLAARSICRVQRHEHVTPALRELGWLPIEARVVMKVATMVFKSKSGLAPKYLLKSLVEYRPRRALRSASSTATLLVLGTARTIAGRRAWSVAAPRIWNSLPEVLRESVMDYNDFLCQLRNYLMTSVKG